MGGSAHGRVNLGTFPEMVEFERGRKRSQRCVWSFSTVLNGVEFKFQRHSVGVQPESCPVEVDLDVVFQPGLTFAPLFWLCAANWRLSRAICSP